MTWSRLSSLLLIIALAGCRGETIQRANAELAFDVESLTLGPVYPGQEARSRIWIRNLGKAPLSLSWEVPGAPFGFSELPRELPTGAIGIDVVFRPDAVGSHAVSLTAHAEDLIGQLHIEGNALDVPSCGSTSSCQSARFDITTGQCEVTDLPDGTACDPHNACIEGGSCLQGRCVGSEKSCDDGNACTIDACNAVSGCEHQPAPPCPGDGKCQVGTCDPKLGCGLAPAPDGATCGPTRTCDVADVCIAGSCVQRDPPDGFICADPSPCQAEGRCQASTCVRGAATSLTPNWSFDSATTGGAYNELHDLVLEKSGAVSLMGFFSVPKLRANRAAAKDGVTPARRCMLWNGRLVCADYPSTTSGKVSAIDLSTGKTAWTFDLPSARPDFVALTGVGQLFMARLGALGSDRLAALFEGYPTGSSSGTQCRLYFLVLLDAAGALVSAQQIKDPMLEVCNHPHPFGMAADVVGNLFVSFSPSQEGQAPLVPHSPTLLVSFTRDGLLRWKRLEQMVGGELALGRGKLYPEKSSQPFLTADGSPLPISISTYQTSYGRPVVTADRVIPSPTPGSTLVRGLDASTGVVVWNRVLPTGASVESPVIRLASWRYRADLPPQTVLLTFERRQGALQLVGSNPSDGVERWACTLDYAQKTAPQLAEIATGSMALMDGASTCMSCDPPFAQSAGSFHTFALEGIDVAQEPWVGTFGGADHDHREDLGFSPGSPHGQ